MTRQFAARVDTLSALRPAAREVLGSCTTCGGFAVVTLLAGAGPATIEDTSLLCVVTVAGREVLVHRPCGSRMRLVA